MGKKRIALPRRKRLPECLTEEQARHLLRGLRNPVHRTCRALMYACGLRIGEALSLEVTAVDRARRVLRIIGKGNKERLVPLPQPMLEALEQVWRTHHNRRWMFPNHRGDAPVDERVLEAVCRRQALCSSATRRPMRRERMEMNAIATNAMRCCFERSKMVFNRR